MKRLLLGLTAGVALALPLASSAHHSAAVLYKLDQQITVEGTVTRFTLGNPHARIFLTVKSANGTSAEWMAEGGSRTVMLRNGWTGDEVKAGDAIKIIGNPSRDGTNVVHWQRLVLPTGAELWGEDVPEDSALEQLRQRRR
ncbi:MAG TPA: DUF6152 family protein [Gammaproteobacteria bacterium]|nr:DUF6152 family protein [Gammaproteobacteria bacterium]